MNEVWVPFGDQALNVVSWFCKEVFVEARFVATNMACMTAMWLSFSSSTRSAKGGMLAKGEAWKSLEFGSESDNGGVILSSEDTES